jgi:hypothetical protein
MMMRGMLVSLQKTAHPAICHTRHAISREAGRGKYWSIFFFFERERGLLGTGSESEAQDGQTASDCSHLAIFFKGLYPIKLALIDPQALRLASGCGY